MRAAVALSLVTSLVLMFGCAGSGSSPNGVSGPSNPPQNPNPSSSSAGFIYSSNVVSFSISGFRINSDGSLSLAPGSPVDTSSQSSYALQGVTAQAGSFLLSEDQDSNTPFGIQTFAIDPNSGALSSVNTTAAPAAFQAMDNMVVNQKTMTVYAFGNWQNAGTISFSIAALSVHSDGSLSLIGGPIPVQGGLDGVLALDPNGRFLYVEGSGKIAAISINADGSLNTWVGAPVQIPGPVVTYDGSSVPPMCYAQATGSMAVSPNGEFVYTTCGGIAALNVFSVDSSGHFAHVQTVSLPVPGSDFYALELNPAGTLLAAAETTSNQVVMYAVDSASGKLTPAATAATGTGPSSIVWDKTGSHMYVANGFAQLYKGPSDQSSDNISGFTVAATGQMTPTPNSPYAAGQAPMMLSVAQP